MMNEMKSKTLRYLLFFVALMGCYGAVAQEMPWFLPNDDASNYKGHVKEVREYDIMMRNDPELQDTDYLFRTFAPDGKLLTEYVSNVDQLCYNHYYWSDKLDSVLNDGDCGDQLYYYYDADNRLERLVRKYGGALLGANTIVTDNHGRPVAFDDEEKYEWYDDGKIKSIRSKYRYKQFEYDAKGRLAKETDGKSVIRYTYNEQGDVVKMVVICNNASDCGKGYKQTFSYTYDSHGNWTEEYWGGALKVIRKILYYE